MEQGSLGTLVWNALLVILLVAAAVGLVGGALGGRGATASAGGFLAGVVRFLFRLALQLVKVLLAAVLSLLRGLFRELPRALRPMAAGIEKLLQGDRTVEKVVAPGDRPLRSDQVDDYWNYRGTARESELAALGAGGVSLGRYLHPRGARGRPLDLPAELLQRHATVIGPSGSGKTEGVIVPWILELLRRGDSVVTLDVKGDLLDRLEGGARASGCAVRYWGLSRPERSARWNFFDELSLDEEGRPRARDLEVAVLGLLGRTRDNDPQPFFHQRDVQWLDHLLAVTRIAYGERAHAGRLYSLVADQQALRDLFEATPAVQERATDLAALFQFTPEEHARAVQGLLNALRLFRKPEVARITEASDFRLAEVAERPTLLVVGASLADAQAAEVLSGVLVNQLLNQVYRRFERGGDHRPLYFVLDEAPLLKDRIEYEKHLAELRAAKVGFCLAAQDLVQFGDERRVSAIVSNCATVVTLGGCSEATAAWLSKRLGRRQEQVLQVSRPAPAPGQMLARRALAHESREVPVLGEREIMHRPSGLPRHTAVVQVQPVSPRPFLVDLSRGAAAEAPVAATPGNRLAMAAVALLVALVAWPAPFGKTSSPSPTPPPGPAPQPAPKRPDPPPDPPTRITPLPLIPVPERPRTRLNPFGPPGDPAHPSPYGQVAPSLKLDPARPGVPLAPLPDRPTIEFTRVPSGLTPEQVQQVQEDLARRQRGQALDEETRKQQERDRQLREWNHTHQELQQGRAAERYRAWQEALARWRLEHPGASNGQEAEFMRGWYREWDRADPSTFYPPPP